MTDPTAQAVQSPSWRTPALCAAATTCIAWALMLPRTALDVQVGNGAGLAAAAAAAAVTGGLARPPGYPLYTALASLVVQLSDAAPYAALATMNAVLQGLAVGLLCALGCILSGRVWAGVAVATAWMLFPASLRAGTDVDVFAFHHVLTLGVVGSGLWCLRRETPLATLGFGVTCGVAAAHHTVAVLWVPFVLALLWQGRPETRQPRWGAFVVGIVIGLSPYLLLWPWYASSLETAFGPVSTWRAWLAYVLREHYGTFQWGARTKMTHNGGAAIAWDVVQCVPGLLLGLLAVRRLLPALPDAAPEKDAGSWLRPVPMALALAMLSHWGFAARLRIPAESGHDVASRFAPSVLLPTALCAAWCLGQASTRLRRIDVAAVLVPALLQGPFALQQADVRAGFVPDDALQKAPLERGQ